MKTFEVTVERVTSYCSHGYKTGDTFILNGMDTPDGFCGGASTMLFPTILALSTGTRFSLGERPRMKTAMAYPYKRNVLFKVKLVEEV
jgi:uncharacterized repeat protein (TIGR04076 family)